MIRKEARQHSKIKKLLVGFTEDQIAIFDDIFYAMIDLPENSISTKFRRSEALSEIIKNNPAEHLLLYTEYRNATSTKHKLRLRRGEVAVELFTEKLKARPKPKPHSVYMTKYWLEKGFTLDEAVSRISDMQRENQKHKTRESYKGLSKKMKFSVDYWMNLGYSLDESEELRKPFLAAMDNSLNGMIGRYGGEEGTVRWNIRVAKYKKSMSENMHNRKSGGYVSAESLKFFIPLYKFCRRLGINRDRIKLGVSGSKEYFIRDNSLEVNGGKFYDFALMDLKLIIEYHGTFWHPRSDVVWNSPWVDYDKASEADRYKQMLAENTGMKYIVVWSDDDKAQKMEELKELITRMWNEK